MDADTSPAHENADDVPLASLWPPGPTYADRVKAAVLFFATLLFASLASFAVLHTLASMIFPRPAGVVVRASSTIGAAIGGVMFGLAIAFTALPLRLRRRFRDRRDRTIFMLMLRGNMSRERAEKVADEESRSYALMRMAIYLGMLLIGIYGWLAWSTMFLGIDGDTIRWRTFSLVTHERPVSDVAAIYMTKKQTGIGQPDRPCVVVHFVDRGAIGSDELSPNGGECDRLASALSEASGKPITPVSWLAYVPKPK